MYGVTFNIYVSPLGKHQNLNEPQYKPYKQYSDKQFSYHLLMFNGVWMRLSCHLSQHREDVRGIGRLVLFLFRYCLTF